MEESMESNSVITDETQSDDSNGQDNKMNDCGAQSAFRNPSNHSMEDLFLDGNCDMSSPFFKDRMREAFIKHSKRGLFANGICFNQADASNTNQACSGDHALVLGSKTDMTYRNSAPHGRSQHEDSQPLNSRSYPHNHNELPAGGYPLTMQIGSFGQASPYSGNQLALSNLMENQQADPSRINQAHDPLPPNLISKIDDHHEVSPFRSDQFVLSAMGQNEQVGPSSINYRTNQPCDPIIPNLTLNIGGHHAVHPFESNQFVLSGKGQNEQEGPSTINQLGAVTVDLISKIGSPHQAIPSTTLPSDDALQIHFNEFYPFMQQYYPPFQSDYSIQPPPSRDQSKCGLCSIERPDQPILFLPCGHMGHQCCFHSIPTMGQSSNFQCMICIKNHPQLGHMQ